MAEIIDGRKIADKVLLEVAAEASKLQPRPCLAIVLVGDNPASQAYVRKKTEACEKAGIISKNIVLPASTSQKKLLSQIKKLNRDKSVHAILVQMPLPPQINGTEILRSIFPQKDVDGLHPLNAGMLHSGTPKIIPCTPLGIMRLLDESGVKIEGANAVVISRSNLVGKPVAALLLQKNATVTVCHSKTTDIASHTRNADIIIAAAGSPKMLKKEMVKPGAVVIDVGTTKVGEKLVGDVDFDSVKEVAAKITPVPGGVGPMTVAMLLKNTLICHALCAGQIFAKICPHVRFAQAKRIRHVHFAFAKCIRHRASLDADRPLGDADCNERKRITIQQKNAPASAGQLKAKGGTEDQGA